MLFCANSTVEGLKKKESKSQAATMMYHKIKNVINSNVLLENDPGKNVTENKLKGSGIFADSYMVTPAGLDKKLDIVAGVENTSEINKVQQVYLNKERTENFKDNIYKVTTITPIDLKVKLAGDVTCTSTEENCYQKIVHEHELIETVKTSLNYIKYV